MTKTTTSGVARSIRRALDVLYRDGDVAELRVFGKRKTYAGYFDDFDKLAEAVAEKDVAGYDCYVTLNPCKDALLGRADNEVIEIDPKRTPLTSDNDITQRRWVMIDPDPDRPAKVSATDEEKANAEIRAKEIKTFLEDNGFSPLVLADSGNGMHVLVPVNLPNDLESRTLVEGFLKALSFKFSDHSVKVDESTFNAARITKPYGVMARKGSHVERIGRVHRRSKLFEIPEKINPVCRELLEAIAKERPEEQPRGKHFKAPKNGYVEFDLRDWIVEHDVPVKREGPWRQGLPLGARGMPLERPRR